MVVFIVLSSVVVFYIVSGWIVVAMATHLLRQYGKAPRNGFGYSSLQLITDLRRMTKDPRLPDDVVAKAKFFFGYLTWGFGVIALSIIVVWVCIALGWIE